MYIQDLSEICLKIYIRWIHYYPPHNEVFGDIETSPVSAGDIDDYAFLLYLFYVITKYHRYAANEYVVYMRSCTRFIRFVAIEKIKKIFQSKLKLIVPKLI